jgi:hypothetical protein
MDYDDQVEVLHQIDIPGGDERWPASVRVERRTTNRNGESRTYINLLIAVGQKKIYVPRRIAKEIGEAVVQSSPLADKAYTELLELQNLGKRNPGTEERGLRWRTR